MYKKIIALICVAAIVLSFSSCSSGDTYYTDENGREYIVARDSDSNIIINTSGKLCVYTLNENGKRQKSDSGEYITEYIDFSGQVVSDRIVETAEMRFTIPNNFTADNSIPGYFAREEYEAEIFINYYPDDIDVAIKGINLNSENLLENYGSEYFSYENYTVKIGDSDCTAVKQSCTSSEYYKTMYFYYIPYDSGYYSINCTINTDNDKKVNFDKFAESIEIK